MALPLDFVPRTSSIQTVFPNRVPRWSIYLTSSERTSGSRNGMSNRFDVLLCLLTAHTFLSGLALNLQVFLLGHSLEGFDGGALRSRTTFTKT
jgi:hypothetical protein